MRLICGRLTRIESEVGHYVNGLRRFDRSSWPRLVGCPAVAGLPQKAGRSGSAPRNRCQTTRSLEEPPPLLSGISRAAAVPRFAVPASGSLGGCSWPVSDRRLDARPEASANGRSPTLSRREQIQGFEAQWNGKLG